MGKRVLDVKLKFVNAWKPKRRMTSKPHGNTCTTVQFEFPIKTLFEVKLKCGLCAWIGTVRGITIKKLFVYSFT